MLKTWLPWENKASPERGRAVPSYLCEAAKLMPQQQGLTPWNLSTALSLQLRRDFVATRFCC